MIYIENKTETQEVRIPVSAKNPAVDILAYQFRLFNTINLTEEEGPLMSAEVDPVMSAGGQYYIFNITLPEGMVTGTYEYMFLHGYTILSAGIAMVGEFHNTDDQFNKDIEYEQYTGE